MDNLKAVLYDLHQDLIVSSGRSDLSLITDAKVICSDGSVNYCKLLISLLDPELSTLIRDDNEDLLIICPDISRQEFVNHYSSIWEKNFKKEVQFNEESPNYDEFEGNQLKEHDSISQHLCDLCGGGFTSSEKLKKHKYNVHPNPDSPKKLVPCPQCDKRFSSKKFLAKHRKLVHTVPSQQCKICLKIFINQISLQRHENIHKTDSVEYECHVCGKKSLKRSNHERHLSLHTHNNDSQRFSCDICQIEFNLKQHLDRHKLLHNKDLRVFCPICNRSFTRSDSMKRHLSKCQK